MKDRTTARKSAQKQFPGPAKPVASYRAEIEQQRIARETKNTKLRGLRLAKEARDKDEAAIAAASAANAPPPPRKKRVPSAASAKTT